MANPMFLIIGKDVEALHTTYPRLPLTLDRKAKYRDPDAIRGGTWEALHRELRRTGYYTGGFPKISVARAVSENMVPERNRSMSFQVFRRGLLELGGLPAGLLGELNRASSKS